MKGQGGKTTGMQEAPISRSREQMRADVSVAEAHKQKHTDSQTQLINIILAWLKPERLQQHLFIFCIFSRCIFFSINFCSVTVNYTNRTGNHPKSSNWICYSRTETLFSNLRGDSVCRACTEMPQNGNCLTGLYIKNLQPQKVTLVLYGAFLMESRQLCFYFVSLLLTKGKRQFEWKSYYKNVIFLSTMQGTSANVNAPFFSKILGPLTH